MTLRDEFENHANRARSIFYAGRVLRKKISGKILNLPDNPDIGRVDKTSYVIKSMHTDGVLSASYYDFKHQYQQIVFNLERVQPDMIIQYLINITTPNRHGACYLPLSGNSQGGSMMRLHPGVCANIRKLIEYSPENSQKEQP